MAKKKRSKTASNADDASTTNATSEEEAVEQEEEATEATEADDGAADDGAADDGADGHGHDDHGHHKPDRRQYMKVFFALFALTVIEVLIPQYLEGSMSKTALVSSLVCLALVKAGIVGMFYMHLNHETKWMRWTVVFPMAFPALYAFILIAEGVYRAAWFGGAG